MEPKAHIVTYGCQMNRQESAVMATLLERAGYGLTERMDEASLVVVETCAIRERAEHKVYSLLGRLQKRRREENPDLKIAICGCVVTEPAAAELVGRHGVDVVLGPRRVMRIAEAVEESRRGPVIDVKGEWELPPDDVSAADIPGVSAFLTVMQGCSNACTFCVVPSRRGDAESKAPDLILEELKALEYAGYREVTLLGQNISYYGLDRKADGRLIDLLERIDAESAIPRVRFATSHPAYIDRRFIEGFGRLKRVMPHLHLPVQSGSNRMLQAMRRGYTAERYLEIVESVRRSRPETAFTTDIITGFDGETLEDHAATLAFVEHARFDGAYVFAYSERPGTPAVASPTGVASVPHEERLRRCNEVLARVQELASSRRAREKGGGVEVLVERDGSGRTPQNVQAVFAGGRPGEIRMMRVDETTPYTVIGSLEGPCPQNSTREQLPNEAIAD
jgi:tRNA-2-methylthio-N6-dimethylallyladenosine synthase